MPLVCTLLMFLVFAHDHKFASKCFLKQGSHLTMKHYKHSCSRVLVFPDISSACRNNNSYFWSFFSYKHCSEKDLLGANKRGLLLKSSEKIGQVYFLQEGALAGLIRAFSGPIGGFLGPIWSNPPAPQIHGQREEQSPQKGRLLGQGSV